MSEIETTRVTRRRRTLLAVACIALLSVATGCGLWPGGDDGEQDERVAEAIAADQRSQGEAPQGTGRAGDAPPSPADFTQAIGKLREQRELASSAVLESRRGREESRISADELRALGRLYSEARAKVNGWLESVLADLVVGHSPGESEASAAELRLAMEKSSAFYHEANRLNARPTPRPAPASAPSSGRTPSPAAPAPAPAVPRIRWPVDAIPDTVNALTDSGIKIFREYRAANEAKRKEIRELVEAQKWPAFESIQ